ncbi:MAG: hypothetical protein IT519_15550 [Burkholderiales bacterium]|nr:hypothetical protein [Burkholderiales bacterium]
MIASTLRKARAALGAGALARARELAAPVLARFPGNVEARSVLGECARREAYAWLGAQRTDDAARAFAEAREYHPDDARLANDHGACLQLSGDLDGAIAAYERSFALADDADALENLASALLRRGRHDASRAAFERLAAHPRARDRGRFRVRAVLQVPAIASSEDEIAAVRARLLSDLAALEADPPSIEHPEARHVTPMFLSYHGASNRDLLARLGRVFRAATPSLTFVAPHCLDYAGAGARIRVGFASAFLYDHSIGHTTRGFLERLDRSRFEAIAIRLPPFRPDAIAAAIDAASDRVVALPGSLASMREAIAALRLDVLFWQDIGMEPMSYFLAFARLAPVQCLSFGHPDTTGVDTLDWFVSGERIEPDDDPQRDYGERLHRIGGASVLSYYHAPDVPRPMRTRAELGFAEHARIYACPQALFKLHPRMDRLFARILERDPAGVVALIAAGEPAWRESLERRFAASLGAFASRIRFVPRMAHSDYLSLLGRADVALDSVGFNGMNTTLESFAMGLPVVTLPIRLQRGRHTAGMYAHMGLERYVARDEDAYVDLAFAAANDAAFAAAWRNAIATHRGRLYRDDGVVRGLERFFAAAVADAAARTR